MSRTVYVNGAYCPEEDARVSIFDRGFLFADAVYEVTTVLDGKLVDFDGHMARLGRSLEALTMTLPVSEDELLDIHRQLVTENALREGMIYLQLSRGAPGDRDFHFPDPEETRPTLILFTQEKAIVDSALAARGAKVAFVPDLRWGRVDIKTVQLLYPSMAKMEAEGKGADDAWLVKDGLVTEGSSNNAWIVTPEGTLVTRQLSHDILPGITRATVLRLARERQMKVEERAFTTEEALAAKEAFITSASSFVTPVISIDGHPIGEGEPGPVAKAMREIYIDEARKTAI
ncbi:D-alanine aminotransferase [Hartmannibacter diazotrophicus]|uniref:Probable branched-chain-amino-acid aminotransferase n=1 Tax=Hartmannibacter diazotrophicus TaxID=1482074 RepID=A0A2C9DD69_9HYPH|nr:D-amino-acid transaminase [Hartmannibacter diazotrophicus]SON58247.1 D-alanine aminotransferase [Hartmannibacter diazotrophicus]